MRFPRCVPLLVVLFGSGCVQYPMGLTETQWKALPPERQAEYRARQTEIDLERQRRSAEERRLREAQEADRAAQERLRLEELYAQARWGDIITVSVTDGMIAFSGKRHAYEPVAFDIARGETKWVEFVRRDRPSERTRIEMRLSHDGNTFWFDAPARKAIRLINDGWEHGRDYHPGELGSRDGVSEAIGITLSVRLKPAHRR